jgi:hypothetical protein
VSVKNVQKEKLEEAKLKVLDKARSYKSTFSTTDGEKVLKDLIEKFDEISVSNPDPTALAIQVGQQRVIKHIEKMIEVNYAG